MNILSKNKIKLLPAMALVITLSVLALVNACSDSFLKPTPLSFYEPAVTFTTESGLQAVMAMTDRHLRHYWTGQYNGNSNNNNPIGTEYLFSDLLAFGKTDEPTTSLPFSIADQLTPQNAGGGENSGATNTDMIQYFWTETYWGIKYANTIISNLDNVKGLDETTKNVYLGRALFHRAFRYYTLVFQYGDVPLITKIPSVPKFNYRCTKKEAILDMITQDLEFAVQWVPDQKNIGYIGMVNKGACRMLLAKCYLATGQWQKAKDQLDNLIDQSGYSLIQGGSGLGQYGTFIQGGNPKTWPITRNIIWDLHRAENKVRTDNTEAVMAMPNEGFNQVSFRTWLQLRIYGPYWNSTAIQTPDSKQALQAYPRNDAKNYRDTLDLTRAFGRGIGVFRPTTYAQWGLWVVNGVMDAGDLRHRSDVGNWVRMEDLRYNDPSSAYYGQHLMLYHPTTGKILCNDTVRCWFQYPLYKNWMLDQASETNLAATAFNGATDASTAGGRGDIYLYRLAEAYLLRAEAKFYLGDIAGATTDVNAVRTRARCTQLYTTVNIGDIMNERARELYMEEWRHVELVRVSRCLALSGKPDEWGNKYDINTYDRQTGRDAAGGSYWWQRMAHYNDFYNSPKNPINAANRTQVYNIDKHNMYWPIRQNVLNSNTGGPLMQAFGYDGYDENDPVWDKWQEAVADEDVR